jgi:branched-chain amino acid aminotransferase group I
MSEFVYLNGAIVSRSQARISPLDYGFLYGFGLFETMRSYDGHVFLIDKHLNRLSRSAELLGIPMGQTDFEAVIMQTLTANNLLNARIRLTVSIGEGEIVPDLSTCKRPTVLITAGHYKPYPDQVYREGFRAIISTIRRNSLSLLSRLKSTSYVESMLARKEARERGVDEALCLNEKGFLAEASMSNIFLVADGILRTPNLESGILPGITRETVLELAAQLNIKAVGDSIKPEEIFHAQEAFITNSLIEIMPLREVDGGPVGARKEDSITARLLAAYKKLVVSCTKHTHIQ